MLLICAIGKISLLASYRRHRRRIGHQVEEHLDGFLSRYTRTISEIVGEPVPTKKVLTRKEIGSPHRKMDSTFTLAVSTFDVTGRIRLPKTVVTGSIPSSTRCSGYITGFREGKRPLLGFRENLMKYSILSSIPHTRGRSTKSPKHPAG